MSQLHQTVLITLVLGAGVLTSGVARAQCAEGVESYQETTYQMLRTNCVACHAGNGPGPGFVGADPVASYYHVRNYVTFGDLGTSRLVERAGNGHCNCGMTEETMADSLRAWFDGGEDQCPAESQYITEQQAIPELPGRDEGFVQLTWDLGNLRSELRGTHFGIEMQRFSEPSPDQKGSYRFRNPRLVNGDVTLSIADIKIFLNHVYDNQTNGFTGIDTIVSPQSNAPAVNPNLPPPPYPILTAQSVIVPQLDSAGDVLSIGFGKLDVTEPVECADQMLFEEKVMPVFATRNCTFCHGGNGNEGLYPANYNFYMDLDNTELCRAFLQRTSRVDGLDSAILVYPAGISVNHPQIFTNLDFPTVRRDWVEWIDAEHQELLIQGR